MIKKAPEDSLETSAFLRLLADLHASELTSAKWQELCTGNFPGTDSTVMGEQTLDDLASDFADIYLNGSLHASPYESAWLDDEGLVCQQPMFEVRDWYAKHNLGVPNWRKMAEDHLVNQLLFLAFLLDKAATEDQFECLKEAIRFMDEHLLLWLPHFSQRVSNRGNTPFYAYLAMLTLDETTKLRELLAEITGIPVPEPATLEEIRQQRRKQQANPQPVKYYPGVAPSW